MVSQVSIKNYLANFPYYFILVRRIYKNVNIFSQREVTCLLTKQQPSMDMTHHKVHFYQTGNVWNSSQTLPLASQYSFYDHNWLSPPDKENNYLDSFQLRFRPKHEMLMLTLLKNLYWGPDRKTVLSLVLWDLSITFDTINHILFFWTTCESWGLKVPY